MKRYIIHLMLAIALFSSCNKPLVNQKQLKLQDAGLVKDWIDLQLQLIRKTTGVTHVAYARHFGYTGVALYESLRKAENQKSTPLSSGKISFASAQSKHLFGPAAANAAFADMFRFFYGAKPAHLASIDSLEQVYVSKYEEMKAQGFDLQASSQLGKELAAATILISKSDGAANASIPYTPLGYGYWEPTSPGATAAVPGWGNNKTIADGSITGLNCPSPPAFSTNSSSAFYNMVQEVYDVSKTLTPEQKAIAHFWDDAPNGTYLTAFGHWFNILKQVLEKENISLWKAAQAYRQLGISMNDAAIYCWKTKFDFNQLRPVTYIRKYMGDTSWTPLISTPSHPEYLAAHATISSSAAAALEFVFGKNYSFTDHSYDHLGMQPRSFSGFEAAGDEAGLSRLFGGIHYRPSIETGKQMGKLIAARINSILGHPAAPTVAMD